MSQQETHGFAIACLLLALIICVMYWLATPAHSQEAPTPSCGPSKSIDDYLLKRFGETVTAAGVLEPGYMYVTSNAKTGTFTVLIRKGDGTSCFVLSGKGFALADPASAQAGSL